MTLEPKRRLGRGLDALLGAYPAEPELKVAAEGGRRTLPIDLIDRNPRNPRNPRSRRRNSSRRPSARNNNCSPNTRSRSTC